MVTNNSTINLAILALLVLIGLGGYALHRQGEGEASEGETSEGETGSASTLAPVQENNPTDAPEEKVSLTTEDVETPSTDVVVRRWEEHIKRIGAKRVRKKTTMRVLI